MSRDGEETVYTYNGLNQLVEAETEDAIIKYTYDGRGNQTEGGVTRRYYYDNGTVAYTKDGATVSSANVLSGDGDILGTFYYNYWGFKRKLHVLLPFV